LWYLHPRKLTHFDGIVGLIVVTTKQSGVPSFKVADLINDVDLMYLAKKLAVKIIEVTDNKERLLQYVGLEETII